MFVIVAKFSFFRKLIRSICVIFAKFPVSASEGQNENKTTLKQVNFTTVLVISLTFLIRKVYLFSDL